MANNGNFIYLNLQRKMEDQPITKLNIKSLIPYSKNPFKVKNDESLKLLAEDISECGLMEPIIVRTLPSGEEYEVLSGLRCIEAVRMNGEEEINARIFNATDINAAKVVIGTNFLQREIILPSERARAYKLRNEYVKKEKLVDLSHCGTPEEIYTQNILAKEFNQSASSIFRYIRLNYLIDNILDLVDEGKIKLTLAVDLSYFSKEAQEEIYQYFFVEQRAVLRDNTMRSMKKHSEITAKVLDKITSELNSDKKKSGSAVNAVIKKYVKQFKSEQELADRIDKLLTEYLKRKDDAVDT